MASAISAGDSAWILASSAVVFFMTPGLALFYGGLVGKNSVIHTSMLSWITILIVCIHWVLFGYTFSFGPGTPGFGSFAFVALQNITENPINDYAPTIPHYLFVMYQMTFAIITAAIISGSVAGRVKMTSWVIFIVCWTTVVYDLVAHWVWAGWTVLDSNGQAIPQYGWLRALGVVDFAGGNVVHITAGASSLALAWVLGPRSEFKTEKVPVPHNVPMVVLGAGILWFGWFGFNGGSALAANNVGSIAFLNTQIAACAAGLTWVALEWAFSKTKYWTAVGLCCGAISGEVVITPGAGYIHPILAIPIGIIASCAVYGSIKLRQRWVPIDDTLDVWSCHGVGGIVGVLLTGFFTNSAINPAAPNGVFYGHAIQLAYQLCAAVVTFVVSFGFTALIALALRFSPLGFKASAEDQETGLDMAAHQASAYWDDVPTTKKTDGLTPVSKSLSQSPMLAASTNSAATFEMEKLPPKADTDLP